MKPSYKRLKLACYTTNISMAVVANLPPLLFLTFRSLYGISYTLLGMLVLINFLTQLCVDLIFSFFSHKFNIRKTVRFTPILTVLGLLLYAAAPILFPSAVYVGLLIGTVLFSASGGLAEVLISPVIAAIPSKDPDREMSKLHSVYAWGVVPVVALSTLFLLFLDAARWQWLVLIFTVIPLVAAILFHTSQIPEMKTPEKTSGALHFLKNRGVWLCVGAIFLGGASECTMAQWCSGYIEQALGIPKVWGDLFGVALFGMMLGIGRTLYARMGKNIGRVLFLSTIGASLCYFAAAVSPIPLVGLVACALTGFCTAMLWPGNLIVASERFPSGGVLIYALMAAGGDFGASVGPQLVGVITDLAISGSTLSSWATAIGIAPEQLGMKLGMLVGMLFPLLAIPVSLLLWKGQKRKQK